MSVVLKFGGTSVGTFDAVSRTMEIIASRLSEHPVVCVSALSKVTDLLYEIADAAAGGDSASLESRMYELRSRHLKLVRSLLSADPDGCDRASARVNGICDTLAAVVSSVTALGDVPDRIRAVIISHGELLSSTIICYALNSRGIRTGFVDARTMIVTDSEYMCGEPQFDIINERVPAVIGEAFARGTAFGNEGKATDGRPNDAVITQGFIASNRQGAGTVLGRGGSDWSASIIASALYASRVEIWTDVDGIRTTDPRVCPGTKRISRISCEEAAEMARFGAKVLHPKTIAPAMARNIPVFVLNSLNPSCEGTAVVSEESPMGPCGIAFKRNVYLFRYSPRADSDFRNCLEEAKIAPDVVTASGRQMMATVDFSYNVGNFIRLVAGRTDILLKTGYSQMTIIGRGLLPLVPKLEAAVPQLKKNFGKMLNDGNVSYVLAADRLNGIVCEIHRYLFEK